MILEVLREQSELVGKLQAQRRTAKENATILANSLIGNSRDITESAMRERGVKMKHVEKKELENAGYEILSTVPKKREHTVKY